MRFPSVLPRIGSVLVLAALAAPAAAQSSSANWRLTSCTINGGGGLSTSASYRLTASIGQESTIGTSSSFGHVLQSGFWSWVGSGLVPILLTGVKDGGDPTDPELDWTGNNPPYALYRSTNCSGVPSSFLTSTPLLTYTDGTPPAGDVVCYSVFGTAPGPIAPLGGTAPTAEGGVEARK